MTALLLERYDLTPARTIGRLFCDGGYFCYTLEDTVRVGPKVPGETAIPAGRYQVVVTPSARAAAGRLWSPREDHALPLLLDVPDFSGVRIHAGNVAHDTEGCILVGMGRGDDGLTDSRTALINLLGRLAEPSWLTITNVTVTI